MSTAFVALGANLGDRVATIQAAVDRITSLGSIREISSLYETEPVGYLDQPRFLNTVLELETTLSSMNLLDRLLEIEGELGRVRTFANAPRAIDLDLLLYDAEMLSTGRLILPHPRMLDRAFVMVPLAEIAAEFVHPVANRTLGSLRHDLEPITGIERTNLLITLRGT